jgi:hypothetical protein
VISTFALVAGWINPSRRKVVCYVADDNASRFSHPTSAGVSVSTVFSNFPKMRNAPASHSAFVGKKTQSIDRENALKI